MTPEEQLTELGYTLPKAPAPIANYVGAVHTGNFLGCMLNLLYRGGFRSRSR